MQGFPVVAELSGVAAIAQIDAAALRPLRPVVNAVGIEEMDGAVDGAGVVDFIGVGADIGARIAIRTKPQEDVAVDGAAVVQRDRHGRVRRTRVELFNRGLSRYDARIVDDVGLVPATGKAERDGMVASGCRYRDGSAVGQR